MLAHAQCDFQAAPRIKHSKAQSKRHSVRVGDLLFRPELNPAEKKVKKSARNKKNGRIVSQQFFSSILNTRYEFVASLIAKENTMADSKYKEHILETIDQLRKRKARPDLDRICHMVERRYGCSPQQTRAQMERLVEAEVVIKVDYKGNTSYRNAAKWGKKASTTANAAASTASALAGHNGNNNGAGNNGAQQKESAGNSKEVSRCLVDAVTAVNSSKQPASSTVGASVRDIERCLVARNSSTKLMKAKLQVALDREVTANQLVKLKNGNYALHPAPTVEKSEKATSTSNETSSNIGGKKRSAPSNDEGRTSTDGAVTTPSAAAKVQHQQQAEKKSTAARSESSSVSTTTATTTAVGGRVASPAAAVTAAPSSVTSTPLPPPQAPTSFPKSVQTSLGSSAISGGGGVSRGKIGEEMMGSPNKKGRPSSNKRKRFKKTHGPDFVENYDSSFEEPEPKCDYCLLTAAYNYHGKPEELLFCKDCNAKAHPSCMDYSADLAMRSRMSPWQCMDCKTCFVCADSGDADSMLFCDACDKGYHMGCHTPKINEKPSGKWVCFQCTGERKKKGGHHHHANSSVTSNGIVNGSPNNSKKQIKIEPMVVDVESPVVNVGNQTVDGTPGLPTPCESPVPEGEQNKRRFNFAFQEDSLSDVNKENNGVPYASDWSIQDVENYFRAVGFPEQASAFRDQEIDGKSLLLLKRSDVLTGLSLKLGPALKIYNHVKCLQTRRLDGHLLG